MVAAVVAAHSGDEKVIFKNCFSFTDCTYGINNTGTDNAKDIDVVILMYNLIEHGDNYSKKSGNLWQYCRNKPAVNNNGAIVAFAVDNVTDSFYFKEKATGQTYDNSTKDVEVPKLIVKLILFRLGRQIVL